MSNYYNSPYYNNKRKKSGYVSRKIQCIQLEKEIFNFINLIRREPSQIISIFQKIQKNYNSNTELEKKLIFNFINNLTKKKISLPPLKENSELNKVSNDLLNYLINIKKLQGIINYNELDEEFTNIRLRATPYGRIRGKYYEAIILDTIDLFQIIVYIMKDIKGRNVLFNDKIKYIGIACGHFENPNFNNTNNNFYNDIYTIIDFVQDFELIDIAHKINTYDIIREKYEIKTPEISMRVKEVFKDKYEQKYIKSSSGSKKDKNKQNSKKKYNKIKLQKNAVDKNNIETKKITVNKSPLLADYKNYSITYCSNFYFPKLKSNRSAGHYNNSHNSSMNEQFYLNFKKNSENSNKNNIIEKKKEKYISDYFSDNNEVNFPSFSMDKKSKKSFNQEKIDILKKINKISKEKNKNKNKIKKLNIKSEDDSKSITISFNTKKNISNEISSYELVTNDKEKDKELQTLLKNQIKNEIKEEIEKEVKEELKAELINQMLISNALKNKLPNLKIPINNNININGRSYDIDLINNTNYSNGKNIDYNTNRSISSIDIFFPPKKKLTSVYNSRMNSRILNYTQMDNRFNKEKKNVSSTKILSKLYNNENTQENNKKRISGNNSFINRKNKFIYTKNPILNNYIYVHNKPEKKCIYDNKELLTKNNNIIYKNKLYKFYNNLNKTNIINKRANSPTLDKINEKIYVPCRKLIIKNKNSKNNNSYYQKISFDRIIKVPKKIFNNLDYLEKNNIIINNNENNTIYFKDMSPEKDTDLESNKFYKKKMNSNN